MIGTGAGPVAVAELRASVVKSSVSDHILIVPTSLYVHRRCVRAKSDKGASEETWQSLCSMAANRSGYRLSANQVLPGGKVMV